MVVCQMVALYHFNMQETLWQWNSCIYWWQSVEGTNKVSICHFILQHVWCDFGFVIVRQHNAGYMVPSLK